MDFVLVHPLRLLRRLFVTVFSTVLFRLSTLMVLLAVAPYASAQLHFNTPITVSPDINLDTGDSISNSRLAAQPQLGLQVMWNSSGDAVIYMTGNQPTGGGFTNTDPSGTMTWEYTYRLTLVRLDTGRYAVALEWSKKTVIGTVTTGTKIIGEVVQGQPDQLKVPDQNTSGSPTNVNPPTSNQSLGATFGSGTTYAFTYSYTRSYMGENGVFYVIYCTSTIYVWLPDDAGGGDQNAA